MTTYTNYASNFKIVAKMCFCIDSFNNKIAIKRHKVIKFYTFAVILIKITLEQRTLKDKNIDHRTPCQGTEFKDFR